MKITGTFLDEISHDIPHQNWGAKEWDKDFASMKAIGIDTVILIRCGYKRFMSYPSKYLNEVQNCYMPPLDLVELYLQLADKYEMKFYFGLYDSGEFWHRHECEKELDISRYVAEEAWKKYGKYKSFGGWYLNFEVSRQFKGITELYAKMGKFVKDLSGNLPTLISPFIDGIKSVSSSNAAIINQNAVDLASHENDWNDILSAIKGSVDIVAFQDGHCNYEELLSYLTINKKLADRYGMTTWTNCETFDRDMPIKFLPIKWEKMLLKLQAAQKAQIEKAITFEFSHFMSPNSSYLSANHLYNRYCEHFQIER